jgi:hypothetical protein
MRDVNSRQRNIVFPDAAVNEARFWRNVISGKRSLTAVQVIGIVTICAVLILPVWDIVHALRRSLAAWLFIALMVALFTLLRWRTRKALSGSEHGPTHGRS